MYWKTNKKLFHPLSCSNNDSELIILEDLSFRINRSYTSKMIEKNKSCTCIYLEFCPVKPSKYVKERFERKSILLETHFCPAHAKTIFAKELRIRRTPILCYTLITEYIQLYRLKSNIRLIHAVPVNWFIRRTRTNVRQTKYAFDTYVLWIFRKTMICFVGKNITSRFTIISDFKVF